MKYGKKKGDSMIIKGLIIGFILVCGLFLIGLIIRFFACVLPRKRDCKKVCPMAFMCGRTHCHGTLTNEEKEEIRKYLKGENEHK